MACKMLSTASGNSPEQWDIIITLKGTAGYLNSLYDVTLVTTRWHVYPDVLRPIFNVE